MLGVELLDGYSTEWGFSIYDVIGNGLGTILYTFQERKFKNQPFKIKFSSTNQRMHHVDLLYLVKIDYN